MSTDSPSSPGVNAGGVLTVGAVTTSNTGYNGGATSAAKTVTLTGGTGSGVQLSISVASGVASVASVVTPGTNYYPADSLSLTSAEMVTAGFAAGGGPSTIAVNTITNTGFNAWVNELIVALCGTGGVGLTQTTDTGQGSTVSGSTGGCNFSGTLALATASVYYVFKFNDTLQATAPIFIKLEFGNGNAANAPGIWITVGTGSNGAGTITGTVMTRCNCNGGGSQTGVTTNYPSNFVYNSTYGFLGLNWKQGAQGTNGCLGGFAVYRSNNQSNGAATGDSIILICSSLGNSSTTPAGNMQWINNAAALLQPPTASQSSLNCGSYCAGYYGIPFDTATLNNSIVTIFPVWYLNLTQGLGRSAYIGIGAMADWTLNVSETAVIAAGLSLTVLPVGVPWGQVSYPQSNGSINVAVTFLWIFQ